MLDMIILLVIIIVSFIIGMKVGVKKGERAKDIENIKNEIKELNTWRLK